MEAFRRLFGSHSKSYSGGRNANDRNDGTPQSIDEKLDYCYVSPRILVAGRPTSRDTDKLDHRNNIDELSTFLEKKHGDNYLIWNLSNKNRNGINYGKLRNQIQEFQPFSRVDVTDETPAMGQIFRMCYTLKFWLEWGPETIAVLHCNTGVLRTGFILACFLVYAGQFSTIPEALEFFSSKREGDANLTERMLPSWRFLMNQIEKHMRLPPALPKVHRLSYVILSVPGLTRPDDRDYPVVQLYQGPKVFFDSHKDCIADDTVRWEGDKLIIEIDRVICGDYQLWILTPAREGGGHLSAEDATQPARPPTEEQPKRRSRRLVARFVFHSSMLETGVATYGTEEVDILHRGMDKKSFSLTLILSEVEDAVLGENNLETVLKRSFINLQGVRALQQGANDWSAHHYTFPDPKLMKQLVSEGLDEIAVVCALQRSSNAIGKTREYLEAPLIKEIFKESAAMRDLKLLRETLTMDEIAGVLSARANMVIKKKGPHIGDLDFSGLLEAAKLGNLNLGLGPGGGDGEGKKKKKKKKRRGGKGKDAKGGDSDSESSDDDEGGRKGDDDEEDSEDDEVEAFLAGGKGGAAGGEKKLFEGDADAKDEDDEDDEDGIEDDDEEGFTEWTMKEHPLFGRFFKMMADGKPRSEVEAEMDKDKFNPGLLNCGPDDLVPDNVPASLQLLKDWEFVQKYFKMMKVGLPRPVVEHKMLSEVMANMISPPKKKKSNKPQIIRKKLHWVPIKGKIEGTIWAGPPADLIAAASQLIDNEKEFERLFIQRPEDLKKRKKKDKDNGGIIQLVDGKRAMNAGIALAKLKIPFQVVVQCLLNMSARQGKHLLSTVEIQNLVQLAPSDDEIKLVKGFTGDVNRLGQCEKFFLAVVDVPQCKQRAQGLWYQCNFDERVKEATARITLFSTAIDQIRNASRLKRLLKAVLVLGNKMNGVTKKEKRKVVKAFTVNSLHQLYLTKAFDQQTSVLQYFIKIIKHKDPDMLRLSKDFKGTILQEAKRLALDVMRDEMRELREGLTALEELVREAAQAGGWGNVMSSAGGGEVVVEEEVEIDDKNPAAHAHDEAGTVETTVAASDGGSGGAGTGGENGSGEASGGTGESNSGGSDGEKKKKKRIRRRVEPLPEFAALAQTELSQLQQSFDDAQAAYKALVKFFKEDPDLPADELFTNIHTFITIFDSTLKAMIEKKKKEKDAKKRAHEMERTKRRAARRREALENGEDAPPDTDSEEGGDGEEEDNSSSDDKGNDEGKQPTWQDVEGSDGESNDDEEDDEKEQQPAEQQETRAAGGSGNAADPRAALMAAIAGKANTTEKAEGGSDPHTSLLAAIKNAGPKQDDQASTTTVEPGSGATASIDSVSPASGEVADSSGDPRNSLLAAIKARKKE